MKDRISVSRIEGRPLGHCEEDKHGMEKGIEE